MTTFAEAHAAVIRARAELDEATDAHALYVALAEIERQRAVACASTLAEAHDTLYAAMVEADRDSNEFMPSTS